MFLDENACKFMHSCFYHGRFKKVKGGDGHGIIKYFFFFLLFFLPFLDDSRTDEKDNNPLRCVDPIPPSLLCLSVENTHTEL